MAARPPHCSQGREARVFAVDLDGLAAERMAAEAEGDATGMQCDVRDEAAVKDLFAR